MDIKSRLEDLAATAKHTKKIVRVFTTAPSVVLAGPLDVHEDHVLVQGHAVPFTGIAAVTLAEVMRRE
jgi:hypothetical protein